eukprot:6281960-Amphidinium_carterae.1
METEVIPGPHASWGGPGWRAAALGVQAGTVGAKAEVAPQLGCGMKPEDHFHAAVRLAVSGVLPFDLETAAPVDLRLAAKPISSARGCGYPYFCQARQDGLNLGFVQRFR